MYVKHIMYILSVKRMQLDDACAVTAPRATA